MSHRDSGSALIQSLSRIWNTVDTPPYFGGCTRVSAIAIRGGDGSVSALYSSHCPTSPGYPIAAADSTRNRREKSRVPDDRGIEKWVNPDLYIVHRSYVSGAELSVHPGNR